MSINKIEGQINSINDTRSNISELKSINTKSNIKIKSKKINSINN